MNDAALRASVKASVLEYLEQAGENVSNFYELVLSEIEIPLLETLISHVNNNQSKLSKILGLNRGTVRKKLKQYGLLKKEQKTS